MQKQKNYLGQAEAELLENKNYLANLNKMRAEGDAAFGKRKASRLEGVKAVTETIEILTVDKARDVTPAACNFLQVREGRQHSRRKAAALVRSAGA